MSVNVSVLTSGSSAYNGFTSGLATASISPASNRLLLLCISTEFAQTWTITGNGLTWELVASVSFSASNLYIYRAMGDTTPSSGSISANGSFADVFVWSVLSVQGVKTGNNGADAIQQSPSGTGATTAVSVTLSAFNNANNATLLVSTGFSSVAATGTAGTGFTELVDINVAGSSPYTVQHYVEWQNANDTSADFTASTTIIYSALGLELVEGGILKTLTNSRSTSAGVTRIEGAIRTGTNSRSTSAAVVRVEGAIRAASNSRSMTATLGRVFTARRALTRSISTSASLARKLTARRTRTNSRATVLSVLYTFQRNRNPLSSIATSGLLSRRGSNYLRSETNSRSSSISVNELKGAVKNLSINIATVAAVVRLGSFYRTITQSRTTTGVLIRHVIFPRALSATGTIDVALVVIRNNIRFLTNTISSSFTVAQATPVHGRSLAMSIAGSRTVSRIEVAIRVLANSRSISASLVRRLNYIRVASLTGSILPTVSRQWGQFRRIGQHQAGTPAILKKGLFRNSSRTGSTSASMTYKKGYFRILSVSGLFTAIAERTITLSKRLWFFGSIQARLFDLGGWTHDEFEPITNQIKNFVQRVGVFFNPRDPGYDD